MTDAEILFAGFIRVSNLLYLKASGSTERMIEQIRGVKVVNDLGKRL